MTMSKLAALALTTALLGACSSDPKTLSFDDRVETVNGLIARNMAKPPTPEGAMPTTGTGTYEGQSIAGAENGEQLVASVHMAADFATGALDTRLADFHSSTRGALQGEAAGAGSITGNTLTARVEGLVGDGAGARDLEGQLDGSFIGDSAEAAVGGFEGALVENGTSSALTGSFIVETLD